MDPAWGPVLLVQVLHDQGDDEDRQVVLAEHGERGRGTSEPPSTAPRRQQRPHHRGEGERLGVGDCEEGRAGCEKRRGDGRPGDDRAPVEVGEAVETDQCDGERTCADQQAGKQW